MADREPLRTVILACGNSLRGDDALGPLFLSRIAGLELPHITGIEAYQLQIENALDLEGADLALFVDAAAGIGAPYSLAELLPASGPSYSTHALAPGAVLATFSAIAGKLPPPAFVLGIEGAGFDLGSPLSAEAAANLEAAWQFMAPLLENPEPQRWRLEASQRGATGPHAKPAPQTKITIGVPGERDP